jgi:hypothetical protein
MSPTRAKKSKKKRRPARRRRREAVRRTGARVAGHLSPRAADALGIGLFVLAALSILGLWFGAGGPFGSALQTAVRGLFGPVGFALPVVAGYWAVQLVRDTPHEDRGRMLVGLCVAALGALGIAESSPGTGSWSSG